MGALLEAAPGGASFELDQAARLLDPAPMALETGAQRLPSGQVHVAARTDMPGCTGEMLAWWFRSAPDSARYAWWHPRDHVSSRWIDTSPDTVVGATHLVEERLGTVSDEVHQLLVRFVEPGELLGEAAVAEAFARGDVSAILAATTGVGPEPLRDERGRPNMGRMVHVARDNADGLILRSHFWLGAGTGLPPEVLRQVISDDQGLGLMAHAHTEFKYLARILPPLYLAENRDTVDVPLPW